MKKFEFKYQFEFFCSPIWIEENVKNPTLRNVEICGFGYQSVSKKKNQRNSITCIKEIFNDNYPPESDFKDAVSEYIFVNRVLTSAELFRERSRGSNTLFVFDYPKWREKISKSTMKEKTATQIEFDEMVKDSYQILKPLGFKKKALHFYRVVEQSLQ